MGRTIPTFRQLIDDTLARWSKFRRALRREDQQHLDRLFLRVRIYTQAATYQCNDDPMDSILLAIALDQEKRLQALEERTPPPALPAAPADAPLNFASAEEEHHATSGMDLRPVPELPGAPADQRGGDDAVADHAGPEALPDR
ncbi:MAG TPA: hypothetical protein VGA40_00295 [Candidatus Acidoferrales bacterium]